ncbi:MAG: hypothetical protein RLZZ500_1453 [Bacteroidota bacterium]|jgi:hypothetical protein
MKKITTVLMVLMATLTFAQGSPVGHLTIFSEDGDKFYVILNGEQQNDIPQTNIRIEDLNQPYYNARIQFEDKSLMDITTNNMMIADIDGIMSDVTYKIKRDKNKKGKMKMNFFSSIPVRPDFVPPSNVYVMHYGQPRPAPVQTQTVVVQQQAPQTVVVQQTPPVRGGSVTQTTTTTTTSGGDNINANINVGGINMGFSINDNMGGGSVTQTTTTTTSSSSSHGNHNGGEFQNPRPVVTTPTPVGCPGRSCMRPADYNAALATLKKQAFEDSRLKTAKQIVAVNCLNVDQVIEIANLFSFEDNKLEFAKYAYDFCIEPRNYFKVNGIFSFSSNADELSEYVQSRQ